MARYNNRNWDIEKGGSYRDVNPNNLWSTKRAREAANENRRKQNEAKYDGVPEGTRFFDDKKEKHKNKTNNDRNKNNGKNKGGFDRNNNDRNNNRNKNEDRRNDNRDRSDREKAFSSNDQANKRKLGVRGRDERSLSIERRNKSVEPEVKVDKLEEERKILNGFIDEYVKTAKASGSIVDVIDDYIAAVCCIMKDYYEPRFNGILKEMNDVIEIMTTKLFITSLYKAMDNDLIDDWRGIWNDVARTISIVLDTSHTKMQDEVVNICVNDILSSELVWKMDIDKLMRNTGIMKELATQLVIDIPVLEEDFTDATLNLFAPKFLDIILRYAEDNADVLMKNVQYEIMTTFFGKDKIALKVIGKYLDVDVNTVPAGVTEDIILDEFYDMIYEFLDDYDIKDIEFVLTYLAKREKARIRECENKGIENTYIKTFDRKHAEEYSNINKAVRNIDRNKPELSEYL